MRASDASSSWCIFARRRCSPAAAGRTGPVVPPVVVPGARVVDLRDTNGGVQRYHVDSVGVGVPPTAVANVSCRVHSRRSTGRPRTGEHYVREPGGGEQQWIFIEGLPMRWASPTRPTRREQRSAGHRGAPLHRLLRLDQPVRSRHRRRLGSRPDASTRTRSSPTCTTGCSSPGRSCSATRSSTGGAGSSPATRRGWRSPRRRGRPNAPTRRRGAAGRCTCSPRRWRWSSRSTSRPTRTQPSTPFHGVVACVAEARRRPRYGASVPAMPATARAERARRERCLPVDPARPRHGDHPGAGVVRGHVLGQWVHRDPRRLRVDQPPGRATRWASWPR